MFRRAVITLVLGADVAVAAVLVIQHKVRPVSAPTMTKVTPPTELPGAVSVHGTDYAKGSADGLRLTVCDMEPDHNAVRAVYETSNGGGAVEDLDGAGGTCARIRTDRPIRRHRTCERNLIAWDCKNWADNAWPPPPGMHR